MSEADRSQSHNANPYLAIFEGQLAQAEAFWGHFAGYEAKAVAQAKVNLEEQARLARETMTYAETLSAEWRRASFELARRTAQLMVPRFGAL